MKSLIQKLLIALTLLMLLSTVLAQGTAFTYQGRLNSGGLPANGSYDMQFTLYATNVTGFAVAGPVTNTAVGVTNGLFTAIVNFGPGVFTGPNYWLEIAVSTNGANTFGALAPRQPLTPVPYAIFANSASNLLGTLPAAQLSGTIPASSLSGTIPSANISGTYGNAVNFNNGADVFDGTFFGQFLGNSFTGGTFTGQFIGDGSGLININPAHISGQVAYLNSNQVFTAQNNFLQGIGIGTTNPLAPLQLDILGTQGVARLTSTNYGYGSVIELRNTGTNYGYFAYLGAVDFNDAANSYPGQIGYFSYPAGGAPDYFGIRIGGWDQTFRLAVDPKGYGANSLINGSFNVADTRSGGEFIGSGCFNTIQPGCLFSSVLNGYQDQIETNAGASTIAGGIYNDIGGYASFIGSGHDNTNTTAYGFIGGGYDNWIQFNNWGVFIGGGQNNTIQTYAGYAAIVGGQYNLIQTNSGDSVIGSGFSNMIQTNSGYSAIGSGYNNVIQPNSFASVIGGGSGNSVGTNADHATIAGGFNDLIQPYAWDSAIAGGYGNVILPSASYSFIGGGNINSNGASYSVISGGDFNVIQAGDYHAVIGGGSLNVIQFGAHDAVVSGGYANTVQPLAVNGVIGGGYTNTIGADALFATISGGVSNVVAGSGGVVPGGVGNAAIGIDSFAAGTFAQATNDGSFVLTDDGTTNFYSTSSNQLSARFTGGIRFVTGGVGMTLDGQPILAGPVSAGLLSGGYTNVVSFSNPGNYFYGIFIGNGTGLTGLNASQLSGGTVPAGVFAGNYTNAVTMTNPANIFAGNGSGLNSVNAAFLGGNSASSFAPASGSPTYIQNQSGTSQAASFNISGNAQVSGFLRLGSETNTASGPSYPVGSPGLVIRRIASTVSTAGLLVARTDQLQLQRDGTVSGLQMAYATTGNFQTINAFGITTNGTMVVYKNTVRAAGSGTLPMFADSQKIVHYDISFGNPYNDGHTCHVVIDRYDDGITSDNYLVGTVTTTYNQ